MFVKFRAPQESFVINGMYELTFEYFDFIYPYDFRYIIVSIADRYPIIVHSFFEIKLTESVLVIPDVKVVYLHSERRVRNNQIVRGAKIGIRCKPEISIHSKEVQDAIDGITKCS